VIEKLLAWYQANANPGERISGAVDRLGMDAVNALF